MLESSIMYLPSVSAVRSAGVRSDSRDWAEKVGSSSATAFLMVVFILAVRVSRYILNTGGSLA